MSARKSILLDSLLLVFLCFWLIKPLFRLKYLDNFPSIESTFIAQGRMIAEHLPHPGWQPLWYCGTRTDYIYPPAVPYGTALISRFAHVLPARAYHIYIAVFYLLGITAVYWMERIGSGSRGAAWLCAGGTALLSPSFLLLRPIRLDSGFWVPQRLHVLMSYGEGPHIAALCVLPAAMAAAFLGLRKGKPAAVASAGALCALVTANNFYGATALAIFFPILAWSVWVGERARDVWARAAMIVLISYGLSAFWLTPSYARITLIDLKWVSQPGNFLSLIVLLAAAALYGVLSFRAGNRRPSREWSLFVAGAAVIISLYVLGFYYFGLRITGEPARLVPELDLFLILGAVEVLRRLWNKRHWKVPAALITLLAFSPSVRYLQHLWSPFPKARPLGEVYEYNTANWVHEHLPVERVLPAGTVRFWFDVWSDNAQPEGGSMQGLLNQVLPFGTFQIMRGAQPDLSILWLKAMGTDAVIVPDSTSPQPYQDYTFPAKFKGLLPVLHDDFHGTVVYGISRVYPGIARVVDASAITSAVRFPGTEDEAVLTKYVAAIEDPGQTAAPVRWHGFDEVEVNASVAPGQVVLLQETWDPAWHAWENGKELAVRADPVMRFMLIEVPAGRHRIMMRFETPLENRAGQVLLVITVSAIAGLFFFGRKERPEREKVSPESGR